MERIWLTLLQLQVLKIYIIPTQERSSYLLYVGDVTASRLLSGHVALSSNEVSLEVRDRALCLLFFLAF